jgi:hypothetical protein
MSDNQIRLDQFIQFGIFIGTVAPIIVTLFSLHRTNVQRSIDQIRTLKTLSKKFKLLSKRLKWIEKHVGKNQDVR